MMGYDKIGCPSDIIFRRLRRCKKPREALLFVFYQRYHSIMPISGSETIFVILSPLQSIRWTE